ncbi:MAG: NADH-quinone oxidoreductase subunit A [Planctomycetes bacterium]|nr:NADH-quinone oxidoreductase subunit A [Planctomycetota bacterium]
MPSYSIIAFLVLLVVGLAALILVASHTITRLLGLRRTGPIKDMPYESGVDPIGDARSRFNVRFYLVAVLFLLFDVEILFLYPFSILYPRFQNEAHAAWAESLKSYGYTPGFFLATALIFFVILAVGFLYEWRKGIFRWD